MQDAYLAEQHLLKSGSGIVRYRERRDKKLHNWLDEGCERILRPNQAKLGGSETVQFSDGVSTSPTIILDIPRLGGEAVVVGALDGDPTTVFVDKLVCAGFGSVTVTGSASRRSPASRSYSTDGRDLELSMSSDSYDIAAHYVGLRHE